LRIAIAFDGGTQSANDSSHFVCKNHQLLELRLVQVSDVKCYVKL